MPSTPLRFRPTFLIAGAVLMAWAFTPVAAGAQEKSIFESLHEEPASLFDVGVKRLRSMASAAASKLSSETGSVPRVRVAHNPEGPSHLAVSFVYDDPQKSLVLGDAKACTVWLEKAIVETLRLNATHFQGARKLSDQAQRRLGFLFGHEFKTTAAERDAIGAQVAANTVFAMRALNPDGKATTYCQGTAAGRLIRNNP